MTLKPMILACFLSVIFFSFQLDSCSTFLIEKKEQLLLCKSYDWMVEDGLVVVNQRDIAKTGMTRSNPVRWISKYGSLTFTQVGREFPFGGMNEAGLVVEIMWLDKTVYPAKDHRPTLNELQWIQYQLDTAATVEEVLANSEKIRIDPLSKALVHFFVVDKNGNAATIEFLNGQTVIHQRSEMATPILTNHPYRESVEFLKTHDGFGGTQTPAEGFHSLNRFVRIATLLEEFSHYPENIDKAAAFRILGTVANFEAFAGEVTQENIMDSIRAKWNIVYDIPAREIHFLTASQPHIRTLRMESFDYRGGTPVKVLDVQSKVLGDVSHAFIPYSYELNRNLIDRYCTQIPFLKEFSEELREMTARYPEKTRVGKE